MQNLQHRVSRIKLFVQINQTSADTLSLEALIIRFNFPKVLDCYCVMINYVYSQANCTVDNEKLLIIIFDAVIFLID